jgi:hypothetical protein
MKHRFVILFFLMLNLMFQSCKENPITPEPVSVIVSIESIIPNHPLKIGEKFRMIVKVKNLDSASIDHRFYINDQFHYDNSVKEDTIFTYVPYIPSNSTEWMLKVMAHTFNGSDFTYYYGQDTLDVISENCLPTICTKWSDLDIVTEFDSYYYPEYYGDQYRWICETNNDTITLIQRTPGSDEGYVELKIKFIDKGINNLPEYLELTEFVYDFGSQMGDTLKSGMVKIQNWDTTGIVSGIILSELEPIQVSKPVLPTRKVFWFNFNK